MERVGGCRGTSPFSASMTVDVGARIERGIPPDRKDPGCSVAVNEEGTPSVFAQDGGMTGRAAVLEQKEPPTRRLVGALLTLQLVS